MMGAPPVCVPASHPPASGHATGHEPRGKLDLGSLSTSRQYPNKSHGAANDARTGFRTLSLARAARLIRLARAPPLASPWSSYLGTLRRSTPLPLRLERRIFASLDSTRGAVHIRLGVAIRHSYSCLRCILIQGRFYITTLTTIFISLSLAEFSLNSTQFLWDNLSSLLSYTLLGYTRCEVTRTHARKGYFILVYCTVMYLIYRYRLA